ncbi:polysaccharide pyruvyl transferase family protein [Amylibacter sp.]|nr:polysaccharide pyruvyl transferase family protein [Amylibacter sp.]
MKIGILTYHRVINVGAILQTFCAFEFFKSLGCEVEIIDLRNLVTERNEKRKLVSIKKLSINLKQIKKLKSIRKFAKNRLKYSSIVNSGDTKKFANFCKKQNYDIVSVGSDTVWEMRKNGYATLNVNEFFLEHYNGKKMSFSASMDPINDIDHFKDLIKKRSAVINKFDFVGVRDSITKSVLSSYGTSSYHTCDPTILMMDHPIFAVKQSKRESLGIQLRKELAEELSLKINMQKVFINGNGPEAMNYDPAWTIEKYLDALNANKYIITDRFHGAILSLLVSRAEIPVIFLEDKFKWSEKNSKIRDLAQRLDVEEFVCSSVNDSFSILKKLYNGELIWDRVKVLTRLANMSVDTRNLLTEKIQNIYVN